MNIKNSLQMFSFMRDLFIRTHIFPHYKIRPKVAELFLTENCNAKCISCACWHKNKLDELKTEDWFLVLDQLASMRFVKVNFTGGEPLLRNDIFNIIHHASKVGIRSLHLNTNGFLLTEERIERLITEGVRSFNISLDGPDAKTNDGVRGGGSFDLTVSNLKKLLCNRNRHNLKIRLCFTVMSNTIEKLPDMIALAHSFNIRLYCNLASYTTFLFRHEKVKRLAEIDAETIDSVLTKCERQLRAFKKSGLNFSELSYLRGHFKDPLREEIKCVESQLKLWIRSNGDIGGCWAEDPVHNIKNVKIMELIDSRDYQRKLINFYHKECKGCGSNYSLNLNFTVDKHLKDYLWELGLISLQRKGLNEFVNPVV